MRYELDENGYIYKVFFGCFSGLCNEYMGKIPQGYLSLEEWVEKANIRAYFIYNNNLVYDSVKDEELQEQWKLKASRKPLYRILYESEGSTDTLTLNDDYTNYDYVEVFGNKDGYSGYGKFTTNNNICSVIATNPNLTLHSNALTFDESSVSQTGNIEITKIIGIKDVYEVPYFEPPKVNLLITVMDEVLIMNNTLSTIDNETLTIYANVDTSVSEGVMIFE